MTATVTLTSQTSPPAVAIDIAGLPVGTAVLSVLRLTAAGILSSVRVRGATGGLVGTTAYVTDWDAPTGHALTYRVAALAADGSVLETSDTVLAAIADDPDSLAWLSDPLDPQSALQVALMLGTDESHTSSVDASFTYPNGDGQARARVGTRKAAPIPVIMSANGANADAVAALIASAPSLLWRPPSGLRLPPVVYGVGVDVTESVFGPRWVDDAEVHWSFTITPTRGPGRDVLRAAWSYADIIALGLTYRDLFTAYGLPSGSFGSYRDLTREP